MNRLKMMNYGVWHITRNSENILWAMFVHRNHAEKFAQLSSQYMAKEVDLREFSEATPFGRCLATFKKGVKDE